MSSLSLISRKQSSRNAKIKKRYSNMDLEGFGVQHAKSPIKRNYRFSQTSSKFLLCNPKDIQSATRLREVVEPAMSDSSNSLDSEDQFSPYSPIRPLNAVINVRETPEKIPVIKPQKIDTKTMPVSKKKKRETKSIYKPVTVTFEDGVESSFQPSTEKWVPSSTKHGRSIAIIEKSIQEHVVPVELKLDFSSGEDKVSPKKKQLAKGTLNQRLNGGSRLRQINTPEEMEMQGKSIEGTKSKKKVEFEGSKSHEPQVMVVDAGQNTSYLTNEFPTEITRMHETSYSLPKVIKKELSIVDKLHQKQFQNTSLAKTLKKLDPSIQSPSFQELISSKKHTLDNTTEMSSFQLIDPSASQPIKINLQGSLIKDDPNETAQLTRYYFGDQKYQLKTQNKKKIKRLEYGNGTKSVFSSQISSNIKEINYSQSQHWTSRQTKSQLNSFRKVEKEILTPRESEIPKWCQSNDEYFSPRVSMNNPIEVDQLKKLKQIRKIRETFQVAHQGPKNHYEHEEKRGYVAQRTSISTKLQESLFAQNTKNREKYENLKKKYFGQDEEDFYATQRKKLLKIKQKQLEEKMSLELQKQTSKVIQSISGQISKSLTKIALNKKDFIPGKECEEIEAQKLYNQKMINLSKLKQLSQIEQTNQLGQLNQLIKLPKISSPISHRTPVQLATSQHIVVTEDSDHNKILLRQQVYRINSSRQSVLEKPIFAEITHSRNISNANIPPKMSLTQMKEELQNEVIYQAEKKGDFQPLIQSFQSEAESINLRPALIFDEPQKTRIQEIFQNIEEIKINFKKQMEFNQLNSLVKVILEDMQNTSEEDSKKLQEMSFANQSFPKSWYQPTSDTCITSSSEQHTWIEDTKQKLLATFMNEFIEFENQRKLQNKQILQSKIVNKQKTIVGFMANQISARQSMANQKLQMQKKIVYETIAMIDKKIEKKNKDNKISKFYQLQFIKDFIKNGADTSVIDTEYMGKIEVLEQELRDLIGDSQYYHSKVEKIEESQKLKQAFEKYEKIKEFKDIDEITQNLVLSARPETNEFINTLLQNEEKLTKKVPKCSSPVKINQKKNLKKPIFDKNYQSILDEIFPDMNLGEKYTSICENIFVNKYWIETNRKIYRRHFMSHLKNTFRKAYLNINMPDEKFDFNLPSRYYNGLKNEPNNLDSIFQRDILSGQFFRDAKLQPQEKVVVFQNSKNEKNSDIVQNYYTSFQKLLEVPVPHFAKISRKTLILKGESVSEYHSKVLRDFLLKSCDEPNFEIEKVIIEECKMSDKSFAQILKGLQSHKVQELSYIGNEFGENSLNSLLNLVNNIDQLYLMKLNLEHGMQKSLAFDLTHICLEYGTRLQTLNLSKMNLANSTENICQMILTKPFLTILDISWCSISSKSLAKIAKALRKNPNQLRELNVSYNSLNFNDNKIHVVDKEYIPDELVLASFHFLSTFTEYLQKTHFLMHLDISGLGFGPQQYQILVPVIQDTKILSLHIDKDAPFEYEKTENDSKLQVKEYVIQSLTSTYIEQIIDSKQQKTAKQLLVHPPKDDVLILTRYLNAPELDTAPWFSSDCHLCNKHKYTIIFYHDHNDDLVEILDPTILSNLDIDCCDPVIYGLSTSCRMSRADVFTLLSISNDPRFINSQEQSQRIKKAASSCGLHEKLKGWNRILFDKCNFNFQQEIMVVNQPQYLCQQRSEGENDWVFAKYLAPGLHHFIIYDPRVRRAFCKEIFVEQSKVPPLPIKQFEVKKQARKIPSLLQPNSIPEADLLHQAFLADVASSNFQLDVFIKDSNDIEQCLQILDQNYQSVQDFYLQNLGISNQYPRVDFPTFMSFVEKLQKVNPQNVQLAQGQIELIFIRATRNDVIKGVAGSLCRSQLLEALVRWAQQIYGLKVKLSSKIQEFIHIYINHHSSNLYKVRDLLQNSKPVGLFLNDNDTGFKLIFSEHRDPLKGFNQQSAIDLMTGTFLDSKIKVTVDEIKKSFTYSKNIVRDEARNAQAYESLTYKEFLEFLGRISIYAYERQQPMNQLQIYEKIFGVTKLIFNYHLRKKKEKEEEKRKMLAEKGISLPPSKKKKPPKKVKKPVINPKDLLGLSIHEKMAFKIKAIYHGAIDSESEEEVTELKVIALPDYELDQ